MPILPMPTPLPGRAETDLFARGGAMGALMRAFDWETSPIGAIPTWPASLRNVLRIVIECRAPMYLVWGREFIQFYNDAYVPILGKKHPAIGRRARETWHEVWNTIGPLWERVHAGEAMSFEDFRFTLERRGEPEEAFFDVSYTPVWDEAGAVGGILLTVSETTARVQHARRLTEERELLHSMFMQAPASIAIFRGPDHVYEFANPKYLAMLGRTSMVGLPVREALPEMKDTGLFEVLDEVYRSGKPYVASEYPAPVAKVPGAPPELAYFSFNLYPLLDANGGIYGQIVVALEVTPQVEARRRVESLEAAARESEQSLSLAVEATGIGTWDYVPATGSLRWSRSCRAIWGAAEDRPIVFADWIGAIHDDDRTDVLAAIDRAMRGEDEGRYDAQFRMRRFDSGDERWLTASGRVLFAGDGTAQRFIGTTRDITADKAVASRRRFLDDAREALGASLDPRRQLRALADAAVPTIADWCVVDLVVDGGRQNLCHVHGDAARVAAAQDIRRRYPSPPDDAIVAAVGDGGAALIDDLDAYLARSTTDRDYIAEVTRLGLRSSIIVPVEVRGELYATIGLITGESGRRYDEDDRRFGDELARQVSMALEHALLYRETAEARTEAEALNRVGASIASELDLAKIVQVITDAGTSGTGAQFGAFFYNVLDDHGARYTLYSLSGVPRERFAHFPLPRATAIFGPTFRGEGVIRLADVREDPRFGLNAPYSGLPPGHLPVVSYLAVPVVSRSGEVHGGLFFGHPEPGRFDASHERLVVGIAGQAAIAIDNSRLFDAVKARSRDLARANEELQQFAYISSHDLQEPLRTVTQYLDLLNARYRDVLDDRGRRFIGSAMGSATRMQTLLDDLLGYSRVGNAGTTSAPVSLRRVVDDVLRDLDAAVQAARARIVVSGNLPTIAADETKIRSLLQNLIGNALKFRSEASPVIEVDAIEDPTGWTIGVKDNGIGIAPEHYERIFDVFQRLHHRDEYSGSGIGLAVCKRIVQQHGGRIWVESIPGGGSTFRFTIPRPVDARS